jgi:thymidylate synthase (FAD)
MQVECIAQTAFHPPRDVPWEPDCSDGYDQTFDGSQLVEFAGRACYQSWKRPNPATATNEGYIKHVIEVGHFSVMEHATVTFYVTGVSRSLTHEQVRHRHFNYSQLSQRYVPGATFVEPDVIAEDPELHALFVDATAEALEYYTQLKAGLEAKFESLPEGTAKRKAARQAARSVLPNATETKIVITGNYRSWWNYLLLRATEHADPEIRELSVMFLEQLQVVAPHVFNHFETYELDDGTLAARLKTEVPDDDYLEN